MSSERMIMFTSLHVNSRFGFNFDFHTKKSKINGKDKHCDAIEYMDRSVYPIVSNAMATLISSLVGFLFLDAVVDVVVVVVFVFLVVVVFVFFFLARWNRAASG